MFVDKVLGQEGSEHEAMNKLVSPEDRLPPMNTKQSLPTTGQRRLVKNVVGVNGTRFKSEILPSALDTCVLTSFDVCLSQRDA